VTIVLYVLIVMALVQGGVSLRDGVQNARYVRGYRKPGRQPERAIVFCPVKGADPDLEVNARSLLGQRYAPYRVVFLIDHIQDPAMRVLASIPGAVVAAAGRSPVRGQKVHSLLEGIRKFGDEADVWVFADADARFPPDWLEELVAPLGAPGVGAATGYRWYVPEPGSLPSLLRSAWNATVAGLLGPGRNNFAWGGSTAIRREVFNEAGIAGLWEHAVSDDYALTGGVRGAGLRVAWVPACLVPAYGSCTWRGLIEFTTRQIKITRVYAPAVWRVGFLTTTLFNVTFLWLTARALAGGWGFAIPWLLLYGLTVLRSWLRLGAAGRAVPDRSLRKHRWFYRLSAPLVALLYQANFILSLASRRIVWKNVAYTMVSPEETRVEWGHVSAEQTPPRAGPSRDEAAR